MIFIVVMYYRGQCRCCRGQCLDVISALPSGYALCGYAVSSQAVYGWAVSRTVGYEPSPYRFPGTGGVAVRGPPSLRASIVPAALKWAGPLPYALVSLFRHRWCRGAWARPNGEGRVDWRGEASLGLDLFGSFWGNAKKNKPHLRIINQSPSYSPPILLPPILLYAYSLITYQCLH